MGKRSQKNKERRRRKLEKAREFAKSIKGASEIQESSLLNPEVATDPSIEEPADKSFALLFDNYNFSECELDILDRVKAKSLIKKFQNITKTNRRTLPTSGIVRDNVEYSGEYKKLFKNLPPDIELKESGLSGTARLIFYMIEEKFYIVSVLVNHRE